MPRLDMFVRINAGRLAGPPERQPDGEWAEVRLVFEVSRAVRQLLSFAGSVEVISPSAARAELAAAAAEVVALYSGSGPGSGPDTETGPGTEPGSGGQISPASADGRD